MVEIIASIKWFRSFTASNERSFFAESPDEDPARLTDEGLYIANGLAEANVLHQKLWIFSSFSTQTYTWKVMPTGCMLGEWQNVFRCR